MIFIKKRISSVMKLADQGIGIDLTIYPIVT